VPLAIFDLDNTLLAGDSDYLWGRFLADKHLVDPVRHERENRRFYEEYKGGTLDIHEFLEFQLQPLVRIPAATLERLRTEFLSEKIAPIVLPQAVSLLESHHSNGNVRVIITATNRFITAPIAALLGVDHLIATDPEIIDGAFTGKITGIPCFREGKVTRLWNWMREHAYNLHDSWFYSDSHNDIPLLEQVTHPVAVDPDPTLQQHAELKDWEIISLREG
jgi:HAD superfamily hydrolase (TIGR01490 family)